jgi:hypothetical protein
VALSGEEIRGRLAEFAAKWAGYSGSERSEAQTFLNQLLACFGVDRKDVGARFEEPGGGRFMDMIWPGVCIVEMKRPSEAGKLAAHRKQALDYWTGEQRRTGNAGRFVVVCAFLRFEVFEPGARWDTPLAEFSLEELPDRLDALEFLRGRGGEPRFARDRADLTREAVAHVTDLYNRIRDRQAAGAETLRDFILQCVWCMFAEDLGMIPNRRFSRLVEQVLEEHPTRSTADDLWLLFDHLNRAGPRPTRGSYEGVPYVDGGLFAEPAQLDLERDEIELLVDACSFDWKQVEPSIFGNLLEGSLGRERVWAFGAHYTAEADIRKVVEPTIVEPWRERIAACASLAGLEQLQREFGAYKILDPACGSGNFLYVAYRQLRRLEVSLRAKEQEVRARAGLAPENNTPAYPLSNVYGLELEPFAVKLARVTLWMAHKLAVDELGLGEAVLPLADLSGIRRADALKVEWPPAEAIIGNPPYIGTKLMRSRLSDDYVDWLDREFRVGVKDYAVYWFRKAHDQLPTGGRAGLVATNSIREGRNREASLEYITQNAGVITDAISSEPWSGEANVHVSIVNWVKRPTTVPKQFRLDRVEVGGITSSLQGGIKAAIGHQLTANAGRQFFGVVPSGEGFVLDSKEADRLLARTEADYRRVVRPYLVGEDITSNPALQPTRSIIYFGELPLEEAAKWPEAMKIVRARVKPMRDAHKKRREREEWWKFSRTVPDLFRAIEDLSRYIACPHISKRFYMVWCEPSWVPSNLTSAFPFDDDYSMGVLTSATHTSWATAQSTTLETRPRYTTASFATFPWPSPSVGQREEVETLARQVIARRSEICLDRQIGLTKLYNEVDEGAYRDLRELHRVLDEAVAAAYGWPKTAAHDPGESNRRLLDLNEAITAGRVDYAPF